MEEIPIKRHRFGEDPSVAWYNLEKTKPMKAHRCAEFGNCIRKRKPNSSLDFHPMEHLKHGLKENAITSEFEFEIQGREKELRSSGKVSERTSSRTKRSISLYLQENAKSLELKSVINLESQDIPKNSSKPSLAADSTSSTSTECDSSDTHVKDSESVEVSGSSGVFKRKKLNPTEQLKTGDSAILGNHIEITSSYFETSLIDVNLTVQPSSRAEKVPFVCLTSKFNGKAVLGYPLEVGLLTESSEGKKRFHQLVWRKSKRTPVCYVTNSLSSSISKNLDGPGPMVKENGGLVKEKSFLKMLKNQNKFKQGKKTTACVPVQLIFSKILAAVGQVQS